MKFKVYNQNGKVKITKTCADGMERPMFSDVADGEMVEITVDAALTSKSHKYVTGMTEEEEPKISVMPASRALLMAVLMGSKASDEMVLASRVLEGTQQGNMPDNYEENARDLMGRKRSNESLFDKACDFLRLAAENGFLDKEESSAAINILNKESAKFAKVHPFDPILNELSGIYNMEAAKAAAVILKDEMKGTNNADTVMLHQYMILYAASVSMCVPADVFGGIKARIRSLSKKKAITPETEKYAIEVLDRELNTLSESELMSMM